MKGERRALPLRQIVECDFGHGSEYDVVDVERHIDSNVFARCIRRQFPADVEINAFIQRARSSRPLAPYGGVYRNLKPPQVVREAGSRKHVSTVR